MKWTALGAVVVQPEGLVRLIFEANQETPSGEDNNTVVNWVDKASQRGQGCDGRLVLR